MTWFGYLMEYNKRTNSIHSRKDADDMTIVYRNDLPIVIIKHNLKGFKIYKRNLYTKTINNIRSYMKEKGYREL